MATASEAALSLHSINPRVIAAEYAVRGRVPKRAEEIENRIKSGEKYPFNKVMYCNIGNPHKLGQHPISYFRQLCSILFYPDLLEEKAVSSLFPLDIQKRARSILAQIPGGIGAYSISQGFPFVRNDVAEFITKRDGYECDKDSIFLTQGASAGVSVVLNLLIASENDGCLIPIPQYPLYSGTLSLLGAKEVPYQLDEQSHWSLSMDSIKKAVEDSESLGVHLKGLVVINPGNPTGTCLSEENIKDILFFANAHKIAVLADEVYQTNIYNPAEKPFVSFRHVLKKYSNELKSVVLFSFHSVSKGFVGECGFRGGYFQTEGLDQDVHNQILKLQSLSLCPNVMGQILVDLMVKPPTPEDESYPLYLAESTAILSSLKRRALRLSAALNDLPGCSCQPIEAALYAFPSIKIPPKAVQAAHDKGHSPDEFYCLSLLEEEGICVVPGSGFGQKDGSFHFRTTILPREEDFDDLIHRFKEHHIRFLEKWGAEQDVEKMLEEEKKEENEQKDHLHYLSHLKSSKPSCLKKNSSDNFM
ncbi:Alanine aminotransferase [Monocercomonoides exilis]|uniref:Alanine aminotransferase n=1 Tax=Monocercomonoides exilis TaxID=2049356 RepID=UPI00355AA709|nr:Alanine aminotransferase [Monocercomonoides exilis]|eukprot:MONOS_10116.1-p1 / transcript=MONOS_10116.1 / gene=MONOS_10116 / organism=Monocercomonoides_exilis_PA203 / gene_product=Alanine aminotransferase / transcript_product=Alanine aminotransferase / location=Mono_scaffold00445:26116-27708(+) / protein_length=531 / sequence_SO=supercontig / SO=protein_coding / is_pseudo=false